MKLLIIGGGAIADSVHIPSALKLLGRENVYLAEPLPERAARMAEKHSLLHVVKNYHRCVKEVDACVIATPPHLHNAILKNCIEAGKHVLCEKPLSPSMVETRTILDEAKPGLVLGMCHSCRFYPSRKEVRGLVRNGFFGPDLEISIVHGSAVKWPSVTGYNYNKELVPGGVLFDMGIHPLDFVYWCLGKPEKLEYEDDATDGLEDNAFVTMHYRTSTSRIRISRSEQLSNYITVSGNGHVAVIGSYDTDRYTLDGVLHTSSCSTFNFSHSDGNETGLAQLSNFLNAIEGKEPIACPIEEGLDVIGIVEECYSLHRTSIV